MLCPTISELSTKSSALALLGGPGISLQFRCRCRSGEYCTPIQWHFKGHGSGQKPGILQGTAGRVFTLHRTAGASVSSEGLHRLHTDERLVAVYFHVLGLVTFF